MYRCLAFFLEGKFHVALTCWVALLCLVGEGGMGKEGRSVFICIVIVLLGSS
jgi:hypothetical protein